METFAPQPKSPEWWEKFFSGPDCIPLSFFPTRHETKAEAAGLIRLTHLKKDMRAADICCGAGRHLIELARHGFDVTGVDISEWLLARARERSIRKHIPIKIMRGDARALPFRDASLDAAWNLFNSFGYCDTDEENEAIVQEAARVLAPGGQFLLDTRNAQYQILFAPPRRVVVGAENQRMVQSCTYERDRQRLRVVWKLEDGHIVHYASFRLYQIEELRAMMQRAGLEEIAIYSGFDGRRFTGAERIVMYHARKPR